MSTIIPEEGVRLLAALRAASALKREPGVLTPTGHRQWFSLDELGCEGRLNGDPAVFDAHARRLERRGLVKHRTQFTVTRWMLTSDGATELLRLDTAAGVSVLVSCAMDLAQARHDMALAERNLRNAQQAMARACAESGELPVSVGHAHLDALTDAEVTV